MTDVNETNIANILKLIKGSKKLGVISLKIGSLEFVLQNSLAPGRASKTAKKRQIQLEQTKAQNEFDVASDELGIMHVEDPVGFEQGLIQNDLIDGIDGGREGYEETHDQSTERDVPRERAL